MIKAVTSIHTRMSFPQKQTQQQAKKTTKKRTVRKTFYLYLEQAQITLDIRV